MQMSGNNNLPPPPVSSEQGIPDGGASTAHVYTATPSEQSYTLYLLQTCFGISYDGSSSSNSSINHSSTMNEPPQSIDNFKISGRDAVPFLSKSGISRLILRNVWTLADPHNAGSLTTLQQLHWILRIIALAQHEGENGGCGGSSGAEMLAKALSNGFAAGQTPMAAMKQCLQETARHVIPLPVFQGIVVPEGEELRAIYVKYRHRNRAGATSSISATSSCNSSVSSSSGGQYAFSNNNNNIMPRPFVPSSDQQQPQGFTSSSANVSAGHFQNTSPMDAFQGLGDGRNQTSQHCPPTIMPSNGAFTISSSSMSIGSAGSSSVLSNLQHQQHSVMTSNSQITDPYHHHTPNVFPGVGTGLLGDDGPQLSNLSTSFSDGGGGGPGMNMFAAASAGGAAASAPPMMMMSTMADSMQVSQSLNNAFGGFSSTTSANTTYLAEQPSLMSVSDAFGDLVVNATPLTTTATVPDLPPLPGHAAMTTSTTTPAPLGMDFHDGGDDDDDFGDFEDASPTAATSNHETPVLSLSSSRDGPATASTPVIASASGWDALDVLAAAEAQQGVATGRLQHETASPAPASSAATLSWDTGISSSSALAGEAALVPPSPQLLQAPVISSSSNAASNNSVTSGCWDALDALVESSTANQPGSAMSIPTTATVAREAAKASSSLPMTLDVMDDHVNGSDGDDDDFGDFNSGTPVSAPPVGEGQGYPRHQGQQQQQAFMTPGITGSSSLDALDMHEQPEKNDYHTSFLPETPAPTVSGWSALDSLADNIQDAPLPGLATLSMTNSKDGAVEEDRQSSVAIQTSEDDDFSGFSSADVVCEPPPSNICTNETEERVEAAMETNASVGDDDDDDEGFVAFSNTSDIELSKHAAASAFRSDPFLPEEAGVGTEARGVSFSPAFDTGRHPLPPQSAINQSERSDSAYYSARTQSINSTALSSEYSLDEFTDAAQSLDGSSITEGKKHSQTPEDGTNDVYTLSSAGRTPPVTDASDDPFAAFDALSSPPPQLPSLSSFNATVVPSDGPGHTSDFNVGLMNIDTPDIPGGCTDLSLDMTPKPGALTHNPSPVVAVPPDANISIDDDFGSFIAHNEGNGVPTAPSSTDRFGAFHVSADDNPDGPAASDADLGAITGEFFTQNVEMANDGTVEASEGTDFGDFVAAPATDIGEGEKTTLEAAILAGASLEVFDNPESTPVMVDTSETDDFGDFETAVSQDGEEKITADTCLVLETRAALIPEQGAAEASEGTDGFGDFEAAPLDENATQEATVTETPSSAVFASSSSAENMDESDDFGDFGDFSGPTIVAPPSTAHATDNVLESNFASFDSARAVTDKVVASRTSEGHDDGWDAFQSASSADTGHFEPTPHPPTDPERENLLKIRERIVAQSLHLPEGIRRKHGSPGEHIYFGDCFDANIGMDIPVSLERKLRMSRCLQLLDEISNHKKLTATYWREVISTARDEFAVAAALLDEGLALSPLDQKKVADPLEGYVHGLGECVRVVRCIVATIGDLLMLDPCSVLTNDTWASSWCCIPVVRDALEVEKLWKSVRDKSKKMGLADKQKTSHKLESLLQIRSIRQLDDKNPILCQLSLQPLSLSQDNQSATKAIVEWDGRHFMACSANFLANKCAFYSVQNS